MPPATAHIQVLRSLNWWTCRWSRFKSLAGCICFRRKTCSQLQTTGSVVSKPVRISSESTVSGQRTEAIGMYWLSQTDQERRWENHWVGRSQSRHYRAQARRAEAVSYTHLTLPTKRIV